MARLINLWGALYSIKNPKLNCPAPCSLLFEDLECEGWNGDYNTLLSSIYWDVGEWFGVFGKSLAIILVVKFPFAEHQNLSPADGYNMPLMTGVHKQEDLCTDDTFCHWWKVRYGSTAGGKLHPLGIAPRPGGSPLCHHWNELLPELQNICSTLSLASGTILWKMKGN